MPTRAASPSSAKRELTNGLAHELLILHVASGQLATSVRVQQSVKAIGAAANWLLLLHDGSDAKSLLWDQPRHVARAVPTGFDVRTGSRQTSRAKTLNGRRFFPKLTFWLQAIDEIRSYRYVWLADEDIAFEGFDFAAYWSRLRTLRPLISQPLIRARAVARNGDPNGKWEQMLNTHELWRTSEVVGGETSYVEQQAAVLDAHFFATHAHAWRELALLQLEHGSDFGLDSMWCGAAALHLDRLDQTLTRANLNDSAAAAALQSARRRDTACALIMVPITHADGRVLNWTSSRKWWARSYEVEVLARTRLDSGRSWWRRQERLLADLSYHEATGAGTPPSCVRARKGRITSRARRCRVTQWRTSEWLPCEVALLPCFPHCYSHLGRVATCSESNDGAATGDYTAPASRHLGRHMLPPSLPTSLPPQISFCYPNYRCNSARGAREMVINATLRASPGGELCCAHVLSTSTSRATTLTRSSNRTTHVRRKSVGQLAGQVESGSPIR